MYVKRTCVCLTLLFFGLSLLGGCSFSRLKKDLEEQESLAVLEGDLSLDGFSSSEPIIIGLVSVDGPHPTLVSHRVLHKPKPFTFAAPVGRYRLFAFVDENNDQKYGEGESISRITDLFLDQPGHTYNVHIWIRGETLEALQEEAQRLKATIRKGNLSRLVTPGTLTQLDAQVFAQENIEMGLWQPLEFVRNVDFGLFFLAEYDPRKIPVLFVHGVSGSPAQFRRLIANLDREHYQPFLMFYPSGFSISVIDEVLRATLNEAQARYGFKEIDILAHSMGGLVTRSFLNRIDKEGAPYRIRRYITISTPWEGHDAALMGLKYAPAIIPVWHDVAPGSDFLKSLYREALPQGVEHYLFFGYRGSSMFAGGNSDGVVSIASQLPVNVQDQAKLIRGYDEDHTSILESEPLLTKVSQVLSAGR